MTLKSFVEVLELNTNMSRLFDHLQSIRFRIALQATAILKPEVLRAHF